MKVWELIERINDLRMGEPYNIGFYDWDTDKYMGAIHPDDIDDETMLKQVKWFDVNNHKFVEIYI